ncbi:MAG: TfoX/Sxy family DNA transformation protein [Pseudomonadota bacterium]
MPKGATGDDAPVTAIRNIGPRMREAFEEAGITTAGQLRAMGADEAYARLIAAGNRPHFLAFTAVVLGLMGRPWNDYTPEEKTALRTRYDALRSGSGHGAAGSADEEGTSPAIEAELNRLGLRR